MALTIPAQDFTLTPALVLGSVTRARLARFPECGKPFVSLYVIYSPDRAPVYYLYGFKDGATVSTEPTEAEYKANSSDLVTNLNDAIALFNAFF